MHLSRHSQTLFSFRDLRNISITDLEEVNERLKECTGWLEEAYTGIGNIITHYDQIKKRKHKLRSLLASIKSDVGIAIQVRLIFEIQAYFFVDLLDFLIEQLIINKGRIYRLMSDKRAKVENMLRKERLSRVGDDISDLFRGHIEKERLFNRFTSQTSIETLARVVLLKSHKTAYSKLLKILRSVTANFSEDVIEIHHDTAEVLIDLLRGEKNWNSMDDKQKKSILRDEDLVGIIDEDKSDVLSCILTNRVINHIKSGKITFKSSHQFRDMGALIESLPITEEEYTISPERLNEMLENKLEITAEPYPGFNFASDSKMDDGIKRVYFQHVMDKVVERVKENNPDWFEMHKEVFFETTDYMFELTYDRDTFSKQFYEALGFMGRNFRFRDDEKFLPLEYFINRYISEQSLDLEHYFLHNTLLKLTNTKNSLIIIDTKGEMSRKKSILTTIHGRYRTVGYTDLRAIFDSLFPAYSSKCKSSDSEAMHIVEILNYVNGFLNANIGVFVGDCHTTSKIAAAMSYLTYRVIAAGRTKIKPIALTKSMKEKIKANLGLSNKVGTLLRRDGKYGAIIASKEHIYVNGMNIRALLDDFGSVILTKVIGENLRIYDLCNSIETSHRSKRVLRIIERGVTRTKDYNVGVMFKASELLMCIVYLYNMIENRGMLKNVWETPMNVHDIVLYAPV